MKLNRDYFLEQDVVKIARDLLGKKICTCFQGHYTSGMITETEAYAGTTDRASHAYGNRKTKRTATLFREGGIAYVYLCYGVHHLFNIVTNKSGVPHAVLLRGIFPLEGIPVMEHRSGKNFKKTRFTDGPGKLTRALGITINDDGTDLMGEKIWIEYETKSISNTSVFIGPRIGIDYAGEDAKLPYRFLLKHPWDI